MAQAAYDNDLKSSILESDRLNLEMRTETLTLLSIAVIQGHEEFIDWLLARRAEVNPKSQRDQLSPLRLASALGHSDIVKKLIENRAELENDWLTLTYVVNENYSQILDQLIQSKPIPDSVKNPLLFIAARKGFVEIFSRLIKGLSVIELQKLNDDNLTLIQIATIHGQLPIVKILVEKKVDINQKNIIIKKNHQTQNWRIKIMMNARLFIMRLLLTE